jgi:peptidyl-prolyl cis-trans isomerase C
MERNIISLLFLTLLLTTAPASAGEEEMVAVVNGAGITKVEFDRNWPAYLRRLGIPLNHADKSGKVDEFRKGLLDLLVDQELLFQEAEKMGKTAGEEQVNEVVAREKADFAGAAQAGQAHGTFEEAISKSGLTMDLYTDYIRRRMTVQNLVVGHYGDKVTVSEKDVDDFYAGNPDNFKTEETIRARHILFTVSPDVGEEEKKEAKKKAEEVLEKARGGEDFAELAKIHSQGPSGPKGGDLGVFGRGKMVPPFEEAVFALKPGEVSDLVETRFGYHIIKLEERNDASSITRDEAADQIREFLKAQKVNEAVFARLEALRKDAKVENLLGP